uniref:Cytosol aminopeptidase n=1 Tax=Panstrongylus lignarius TaxID=156445 RepID=A0A224XM73_9HEMI
MKACRIYYFSQIRTYADCGSSAARKGLVLGAYDGCTPAELKLTKIAQQFDEESGGKIKHLLKGGAGIKKGTAQVFTNISNDFYSVAVAGLGPEGVGLNDKEQLDECKENIRWAAATGARALQDSGINSVLVENFTNSESAAEGSILAVFQYQDNRNREHQQPNVKVELHEGGDKEGWARGALRADNQNFARKLEETPGNLMTPSIFAQMAIDSACPCGVQVDVRDRDWLETKRMNAFLTMAKGSCEEPLLLDIGYCGAPVTDKPVILIGKAITFDTGGLCLKNCEGMSENRGDLAGAAVTLAVVKCAAQMALPMNIRALIPLCESMPGGRAVKPGDVVVGLNGKTITIADTDNEGRITLVDPLVYSKTYLPCLIITTATLTPGIRWGLGSAATGIFTNSNDVWRELQRAGAESGDRVWRFPFWKYYKQKVTEFTSIDVHNVGEGKGAGPPLGAAFLKEFVPPGVDYLHLDITGTGLYSTGVGAPYLKKGVMTGRPVRTLVQFLYQTSCPHDKGKAIV